MKVVVAGGLAPEGVEAIRLRVPAADVVVVDDAHLAEALRDADAVVCHTLTVSDTAAAERLRLVQAVSAGADRIDRAAIPPGCTLCNVHGHERAIAEWVLMAMLALPRQIVRFDHDLRRGVWHRHGDERLDLGEPELEGKTVGVIGYGPIGRTVAELARAVGANVRAVTRTPRDGAEPLAGTRDLLAASDFAVVCIALSKETETLIGRPELDALGPAGYLVNVARAGIVDEEALYGALRDRRIAGAALDVWWNYPGAAGDRVMPSNQPFHELENVLLSPHVSGRSRRTTRRRWEFIAAQLERLADGDPLENVVYANVRAAGAAATTRAASPPDRARGPR